jgi:osmoprotectant transport system ATP-binding protein
MQRHGRDFVLLLDDRDRPRRWVNLEDLGGNGAPLGEIGWPAVAIVEDDTSLYETLDIMITSYKGSAIVVDRKGAYEGVVDFDTVLEAIDSMRPSEQQHYPESGKR